jgi:hypothetical protein
MPTFVAKLYSPIKRLWNRGEGALFAGICNAGNQLLYKENQIWFVTCRNDSFHFLLSNSDKVIEKCLHYGWDK